MLLSILAIGATDACAMFLPGRGNPRSECYVGVEVGSEGPAALRGTRVAQEACGRRCKFSLQLCTNALSPRCRGAEVTNIFVVGDVGKTPLARPPLRRREHLCGPRTENVTLELAGRHHRRAERRLTFLAVARRARPRRDRDTVTLVCEPSHRSCCGDGVRDAGEECDDGNDRDGDGCDGNCTASRCGNGRVAGAEECDDGNDVAGDGCDPNCTRSRCGNGFREPHEECDPPGTSATDCPPDWICGPECACELCLGAAAYRLELTTEPGEDACGAVTDSAGQTLLSLGCGKLLFGGGNTGASAVTIPGSSTLIVDVTRCDGTLHVTGADDDAKLGPPLAAVDSATPANSVCIVNHVLALRGSFDAAPEPDWMEIDLDSQVFLTGDLLGIPGVQPCPLCNGGVCQGGQRNGQSCGATSDALPSHDCPPPPEDKVASLRLTLPLTTGVSSLTAFVSGSQQHVFCGYCRDSVPDDSDFSLGFGVCIGEDGPTRSCLDNSTCTGRQCGDEISCTPAVPCQGGDDPRETCEQRYEGAFNKPGAWMITETGAPPGDLTDGLPHPGARLVAAFCVPPTFDRTVDNVASLPGPGAVSLPLTMRLRPAGAARPER